MKNKYLYLAAITALSVFSGCEKEFLDRPPQDTLVDANFFKTNDQILAASAPLYTVVWKDYVDKSYWALGDVRGGTLQRGFYDVFKNDVMFRTTGIDVSNVEAYRSFYVVVGQANTLIQNVNRYAGAAVSPEIKNHAIAEARFMRAVAYYFLVSNYGPVPIIENNLELLNNADVTRNTVETVWEFISRDLEFAAANLPATAVQPGRITKWSAEGFLAKVFLTRAGVESKGGALKQEFLDKAKTLSERVITMSGKGLLPKYEDLFKFPYDNNNESLFEQQWVFTSDYGYANTMVSQLNFSNDIAPGSDGWGGDLGASWWMLSLYDGLIQDNGTKPGFTLDQRLKATFMLPGANYPEITQTVRDAAGNASKQKLVFPAPAAADQYSFANVKKYVIGNRDDVGDQVTQQRYPNNTYMLRLADMYLIYAEAALGSSFSTSDPKALEYFNKVHMRAGLPVYTGPLTWDIIFQERAKEFAVEGVIWYDLVRLHYSNPQKAYDIINSQDREIFVIRPDRMPNPTGWTFTKTSYVTARTATANSGNFQLPIPTVEQSQAPSLRNAPVPYVFK
jgi:starch-binding outer membrane protein, SusD/RagB family